MSGAHGYSSKKSLFFPKGKFEGRGWTYRFEYIFFYTVQIDGETIRNVENVDGRVIEDVKVFVTS